MPLRRVAQKYGEQVGRRVFAPPRRRHHRDPAAAGLDFEVAWTTTVDGIALHLWVLPPASSPGLPEAPTRGAIVGHGIGLTKSAGLRQAAMLAKRGYAVVMYDHRNHGQSGTDQVSRGMAERFTRDVQAAAAFALDRFPAVSELLAYGFSFSSFPSVYALRDTPEIAAVVCDSGPAVSISSLFAGFADAGAVPIPGPLRRTPFGRWAMDACVATAVDLLDASWPPPAHEGRLDTTPMLFIVGRGDTVVPAHEVESLAGRYGRASCSVLEGGHLETSKTDPVEYESALAAFVAGLP